MSNGTAVIVGVGAGLGASLVRGFAAIGLDVVAVARNASARAELADGARSRVTLHDCDTTDPAAVQALFASLADRTLEAVVYNAGAFAPGPVAELDPADFERCWRVGCFGGFLVGQAAARAMLVRGRGSIFFTGATASLRGGAGFANLASPKFALRALAQSMARELGPAGIHVAHVIIDGQIHSPRYAHLAADRGPDALLEPDAIAASYVALHQQPRSTWTQEMDLRPWSEKF
jgi:NAD(P)-dependent dehydrogenase (short-subunit alcohol dehydrogenase family)